MQTVLCGAILAQAPRSGTTRAGSCRRHKALHGGTLGTSGGDYKPALTAAYNVLQQTNARIKHIIVLGDGEAEDSYSALVTRIHKAGITISTVATGGGAGGFGADYGGPKGPYAWRGRRRPKTVTNM